MKIGILGTRGIPNNYGGFEQFAEFLSKGLAEGGHQVFVYNSHDHPFQEKEWNKVNIIHIFNPEKRTGTWGQFIYDFNCILDSRSRSFDILLQLGYTSSSVWGWLMPRNTIVITNMDGLEWKRTKYNKIVQRFLRYAEKLAVSRSDYLIADSKGIQSYLMKKYGKESQYIPYGTELYDNFNSDILSLYDISPLKYNMLIARIEPENSIELILEGVEMSNNPFPFLVIGNPNTNKFGTYLQKRFSSEKRIRFLGSIYDIKILNNLRYFSNLYFHGHTVGGTNPSLLEAMASGALICAHDNEFNSSILEKDAFYFKTADEVSKYLEGVFKDGTFTSRMKNNFDKIREHYMWENVIKEYGDYFTAKLKTV